MQMVNDKTDRKNYQKGEYLPEKLVQKLQDEIFSNHRLSYPSKNNFLQCVSIIFFHQVTQGNGLNYYAPLGRNYWHKIYGGNYHDRVISPLIIAGIIESIDFGCRTIPDKTQQSSIVIKKGDVSTRYRINPELLSETYSFIPYINKRRVVTALERMLFDNQELQIPDIPDLNFRISIDIGKAGKWVENNAEQICNELLRREYINSLPDGLQIECHEYLDRGSFNVKYCTVKWAKFIAESRGKELFYFNNSFYIATVDEFLQYRIPSLIYHYKHQISQVATQPIEEKQSPVTLRIYSHLTNFPSRILQFIYINNKTVVQLDLRTSQFLIFANLLNVYIKGGEQHLLSLFKQSRNKTYLKRLIKVLKQHQEQLPAVGIEITDRNSGEHGSSDVTKFIRDVFYRDFYEVVAHELGMKERLLAKYALFKLLFKKTNRPDALLHKLSQLYPVVVNIIAEFKKPDKSKTTDKADDNRESNFSVFLQCIEAEIFVDNILKNLRENNVPCFTRHDSVVVADGHQDDAEMIAKDVFRQLGFKYNHKVEDKFWEVVDFDELEDSTYMQWLTDEDILTTNYDAEYGFDEQPINEIFDMDEYEMEICQRLRDIGMQDDYFEHVDAEYLEDISNLPWLNQYERNILHDDVINLWNGYSFLQDKTNQLLRNLAERMTQMRLPND